MYRIRVRGRLTERMSAALDGMTLRPGQTHSTFTGEVKDQAHLHGLLNRLSDLGLELLSVTPEAEPTSPPDVTE